MTEMQGEAGVAISDAGSPTVTAGMLLRQARQARGLHIAALATAMKVAPRKLELLEADRLDELPGPTFTRALAQTVCRSLKIDAAPVLARLPAVVSPELEHMSRGLNEPFKDRPGRHAPGDASWFNPSAVFFMLAVLGAALAIYALPANWLREQLSLGQAQVRSASAPAVAAEPTPVSPPALPLSSDVGASEPMDVVAPSEEAPPALSASAPVGAAPMASVPVSTLAAASAPMAAASAAPLWLRARGASWVEVADASGRPVLSRMLHAGEIVSVDGVSPLRIKIGKASVLDVRYKGVPVDLAPLTTRDVARVELK